MFSIARVLNQKAAVLAALFLLFAGAAVVVGAVFCAGTVQVSRRTGPAPNGAQKAEILADDHARLKAWWFPADPPSGSCVVVLHGVTDSKAGSSGFAPMFLAEGYSVLAPDSRAHGESGGEFVTYGLLERNDVIGWAHWMQKRGCLNVYGLGESMGASILIQASAVEPVFQAIVAESSFADLRSMAVYRTRRLLPLPPLLSGVTAKAIVADGMLYAHYFDGLDFGKVAPLTSIAKAAPVLLIHGLDDLRAPPQQSKLLAAVSPWKDRLWLVPHAGHTNASQAAPIEFRSRVLHWFQAHQRAVA